MIAFYDNQEIWLNHTVVAPAYGANRLEVIFCKAGVILPITFNAYQLKTFFDEPEILSQQHELLGEEMLTPRGMLLDPNGRLFILKYSDGKMGNIALPMSPQIGCTAECPNVCKIGILYTKLYDNFEEITKQMSLHTPSISSSWESFNLADLQRQWYDSVRPNEENYALDV